MIKIKSIQFPQEHSVLGNLELNFCDNNGTPADTIIIAGENGTGKTTILEEIYKVMRYGTDCKNLKLKVLCDSADYEIDYYGEQDYKGNFEGKIVSYIDKIKVNGDPNKYQYSIEKETKFNSIYSTVNINFSSDKIEVIKASNVDNKDRTHNKFNEKTATNIKQLFVDITNYDNKIIADKARENMGEKITEEMLQGRMDRFKNAFDDMFINNIKYKGIDNINGNIEILFEKKGKEISIDDLSSGEKQIVFRGAFLLQDKEALNGAVVLIDEPEISMHPKWQQKILDYYRKLFLDNNKQTSQIIVSTHSNFVIENALKLDNCVIIALQENNQVKKITKDNGTFILPVATAAVPAAVTAAEINYHVFNIASTDYHIQLFGYLHSLMEKHFSKEKMGIKEVDSRIEQNANRLFKVKKSLNNKNLYSSSVTEDKVKNKWEWKDGNTTYQTICCFIRNAIDHPEDLPTQTGKKGYTEDDLRYSIEVLIELINLAKSGSLK